MFGGDPQRTNYYPYNIKTPLKILWFRKMNAAVGKTIIAVDSILYFGTQDGEIHALHIETGEKLGKKKVDFSATCAYHKNNLIIARRYGDNTLYNFNLTNDKLEWKTDAGDIESEPLITSNEIIITALYKHIDLYTIDSGVKIWSFDTEDQIRSSPAIYNGTIISGCDDGYIYSVKKSNGQLDWKFKTAANISATPVIDKNRNNVYIGSADHCFYAINMTNSKQKWKFETKGQLLNTAALSDTDVIFGSTDKNVYCLNPENGKLKWKFGCNSVISTNPLIAGETVFFGSLDHYYYAVDINTGKLLWKYETKGRIITNPIVWGDYLVGASEETYIYVFKAERY